MDTKKEIKFCENTDVNKTMVEAYKMAKAIPFNNNSDIYFNQIYEGFSNRMAVDEKFLKDMECIYSRDLFKRILDETEKYDVSNIQLNQIEPNDILLIKCPSIFAPYHFIIAVVNQAANNIAIYQSFGSSRKLFKKNLPFVTFIELMGRLSTFKNTINFNHNIFFTKCFKCE